MIEFVFENCEIIAFPEEYVQFCSLRTCGEEYFIFEGGELQISPIIKEGTIIISPLANEPQWVSKSWDNALPFDRFMRYNDITCINFGERHTVVKWDGGSDEINDWQTTEIDEDGFLILTFRGE